MFPNPLGLSVLHQRRERNNIHLSHEELTQLELPSPREGHLFKYPYLSQAQLACSGHYGLQEGRNQVLFTIMSYIHKAPGILCA